MILSANSILSDNQAITATTLSTNILDLGVTGTPYGAAASLNGDVGKGTSVPLLIQVTEGFNNLTSLTIAVETGSTTSLGKVLVERTVPVAELVAGYQFNDCDVPQGATDRYLGIRYTVTGTAPTTGKVTAGISAGNQTNVTGA